MNIIEKIPTLCFLLGVCRVYIDSFQSAMTDEQIEELAKYDKMIEKVIYSIDDQIITSRNFINENRT